MCRAWPRRSVEVSVPHLPEEHPVSLIPLRRGCVLAASSLVLLTSGTSVASASPDPGDSLTPTTAVRASSCPLERIGRQLVRCDFLTGAGVSAPLWISEQSARVRANVSHLGPLL